MKYFGIIPCLYGMLIVLSGTLQAQTARHLPMHDGPGRGSARTPIALPTHVHWQPPQQQVRTAAEWEEVETLLLAWHSRPNILREIARYAQDECEVLILCRDSNVVKADLARPPAVPLRHIRFLEEPTNTIWIRDYASQTIYSNQVDSLNLVDWAYNRQRPQDDEASYGVAKYKGIKIFSTVERQYRLVHVGGNFMTDGMGTAMSSRLVLSDNANYSETDINTLFSQFMGIHRYIKMPTLPYDGIHHLDMHWKLLDEETLVVGEYPPGVADGPQIESNLQYVLQQFKTPYGNDYKVIRLPMPADAQGQYPDQGGDYRTYTNSVFINKTLLVPTYNTAEDTTALRIYREALPGYRIIGIDCNDLIYALGAVHCITQSIGVRNPLLIQHSVLPNTSQTQLPYTVTATLKHRSGIRQANLFYRSKGQPYQSVPMRYSGLYWVADIPAQPFHTTIEYYIEAEAHSGKVQRRPMPAPAGYWSFEVKPLVATQTQATTPIKSALYPNPTRHRATLSLNLSQATPTRIELWNMHGQKLNTIFEGRLTVGQTDFTLEAQTWPKGNYIVTIITENETKNILWQVF